MTKKIIVKKKKKKAPAKKPATKTTAKTSKAKAFKQFCQDVERSNKKFAKATPAEKRVMVARDIIKMLELRRITPVPGLYVSMDSREAINSVPKDGIDRFQVSDLLKIPSAPACSVCAIGAAMVASTLRLNEATAYCGDSFYQTYGDNGMTRRAQEVFTDDLLRVMERVFESELGCCGYSSRDRECLLAIYRNIIRNKGKKFTTFAETPKTKTVELWPVNRNG
jgi:hypothetical protein